MLQNHSRRFVVGSLTLWLCSLRYGIKEQPSKFPPYQKLSKEKPKRPAKLMKFNPT